MTPEQFEGYRPRLFAIAYRMLGTVMDAEDAVQDTFLGAVSSPADVQSEGAYLRATLIHLCINQLHAARTQREQYIGPWLPAPLLTAPGADPADALGQSETLSMAFLLLMEQLSPEERAVFVLREAFDYPYSEIAALMHKSEVACRKLFSRAHAKVEQKPIPSDEAPAHSDLSKRLMQAMQGGEIPALFQLLAPDVLLRSDGGGKVSGATRPLQGAQTVASFIMGLMRHIRPGDTFEVHSFNGREGALMRDAQGAIFVVILFEVQNGVAQNLYFIRNPDKLAHLPPARQGSLP